MSKPALSGAERRKTRRRPILATFSLFTVVPKKGFHRLLVHDVSDHGIGFDFDTEGESLTDFPIQNGEVLDLRLYLNQSLYLPLSVQVVRVEEKNAVRRIGGEFNDKKSASYKAFLSFLQMLDAVVEIGVIDQPQG